MLCTWPRFVGSVEPHLPQAFLKDSFRGAWKQDFDILDQTSRHHLRNDLDVNQWLIRLRQIMEGKFVVRKPIRNSAYILGADNKQLCKIIREQALPMICLHDGMMDERVFQKAKPELREAFEAILPVHSTFEA